MKLFSALFVFVLLASLCFIEFSDARKSRNKSVQGEKSKNFTNVF